MAGPRPWKTGHERLRRWTVEGTWERIFEHAVVEDDALGHVERGRPPAFDRERYRGRTVVERCFNRRKPFRALATPYAKRAACC